MKKAFILLMALCSFASAATTTIPVGSKIVILGVFDGAPTGTLSFAGMSFTLPTGQILTQPKFADLGFIADSSGNEMLRFDSVANAVNELTLGNAATGNKVTLTASGGDTNVSINLVPKGTGTIQVSGVDVATVSDTQTLTGKTIAFGSNTLTGVQPLDTELTAIAGLTSAANKGIYFTGSGTAGTFDITSFGRTLAGSADAAAAKASLGFAAGNLSSKSADIVSNTTPAPVTGLTWAIGANETWNFTITLVLGQASATGGSAGWTVGVNANQTATQIWQVYQSVDAGGDGDAYIQRRRTTQGSFPGIAPASTSSVCVIQGSITNGATPGTAGVYLSQTVSSANASWVDFGSFSAVRVP